MNVVRELQRINEKELAEGIDIGSSWHAQYKDSAWIYIGGLPYELTEGDVICIVSQFGEVEDIHLVRDEATGKSKGFAFVKYEDNRSAVLAVDNFNGVTLLGRVLRVDHKLKYAPPKKGEEEDKDGGDSGPQFMEPGHAYKGKELANEYSIHRGVDVFAPAQEDTSRRIFADDPVEPAAAAGGDGGGGGEGGGAAASGGRRSPAGSGGGDGGDGCPDKHHRRHKKHGHKDKHKHKHHKRRRSRSSSGDGSRKRHRDGDRKSGRDREAGGNGAPGSATGAGGSGSGGAAAGKGVEDRAVSLARGVEVAKAMLSRGTVEFQSEVDTTPVAVPIADGALSWLGRKDPALAAAASARAKAASSGRPAVGDNVCFNCGLAGHFSRDCPKQNAAAKLGVAGLTRTR